MPSNLTDVMRRAALAVAALLALMVPAQAANEVLRIPVGRAEVVTSADEVKTVAIAEPKIADAAVGSARTVVVNGKSPGTTTLVVYNEGGRYKIYEVVVNVPNSDRQVKLSVTVAEVNNEAKKELGFDLLGMVKSKVPWLDGSLTSGLYTTKVEVPSIPLAIGQNTDGVMTYVQGSGNRAFQATWRALEQKGAIRTLANPVLVARSGEKANFLSGGEFPVPVAGSSNINDAGTVAVVTSAVRIEWKEFGVRLEFTPTVLDNETISLKVAPEVSALDFSNALKLGGFVIPVMISRKTATTVDIRDGQFLVIGGLKLEDKVKQVKKIPILGHIPLLGFFFTNTRTESVDRELMVVVSPELIAASDAMPVLPTDRPRKK